MISKYTINQIEPLIIPTTKTELLTFLRTLNFISVKANADNTCTIYFDDSPKSTSLNHHLSLLAKNTTPHKDFVNKPDDNLRLIIIKEKTDECKALLEYIKTLPHRQVIESKNEETIVKVNTEEPVTNSLVDLLKEVYGDGIINYSSPGDIVIELKKVNNDTSCW